MAHRSCEKYVMSAQVNGAGVLAGAYLVSARCAVRMTNEKINIRICRRRCIVQRAASYVVLPFYSG